MSLELDDALTAAPSPLNGERAGVRGENITLCAKCRHSVNRLHSYSRWCASFGASFKFHVFTLVALIGAALFTGCVPVAESVETGTRAVVHGRTEGAYRPRNADQYALENTERFVLMNKSMERSVTCPGIQERRLEDGRLEVVANVRNRRGRRIEAQIDCVFKDEQGFPTGDEAPFQTLILTENAQEAVRFVSMNDRAQRYTIRVRSVR